MKNVDREKALNIIERMIRRRLKAQNKEASYSWIKQKALDIYEDSAKSGDYIKELEESTELH